MPTDNPALTRTEDGVHQTVRKDGRERKIKNQAPKAKHFREVVPYTDGVASASLRAYNVAMT